ncbi:MAG TPA: hypothetical protein VE175_11875 [Woeseiaceae bacterium]|nr:hypothetical protein [Woeseiaceae bacterium]
MRPLVLTATLLALSAAAQEDPWSDEEWEDTGETTVWSGFVEMAAGTRLHDDPLQDDRTTLADLRWRVETERPFGRVSLSFKADAGFDGVEDETFADLRELTISLPVGDALDVKLGRQVLTWGTGDLLFLNDLFPKDFVSFFAGRDDEYLKAPSTSLRATWYGAVLGIDFAWTPVFEPDEYLTGERFSFFSPLAGGVVAPDPPISADTPDESLANGELGLRIFRNVAGREYALYGYRGFTKQPTALTPALESAFAPLSVYGASLRMPAGPGLFHGEIARYDSRDDRGGADPLVPNDQLRALVGYEWEAIADLTLGMQYYVEWTLDHHEMLATAAVPAFTPDEFRHVVTGRLTWRTGRDRYTWSVFTFLSPSDRDVYLRPRFTLRYSDAWSLDAGANLFAGAEADTFFGQLEDASNVYLRLRYHY